MKSTADNSKVNIFFHCRGANTGVKKVTFIWGQGQKKVTVKLASLVTRQHFIYLFRESTIELLCLWQCKLILFVEISTTLFLNQSRNSNYITKKLNL